ncbi:choice-of-anchor L domain-containing protein [Daejeonella sp.]|uniref:choice-of-anchor L domain-containing protein n=1 Tax=Daejeonella sp. TaxID=2805397 RepID=UPI0027317B6D|nr:choice-of-anchor L domain-containing protein [Daejeonella sp.]MDP2412877.1 choice-of-anchor L domain-containing protein [Daejeonella sp.]
MMKKYLFLLVAVLFSAANSFAQIRLSSIKVDEWVKKNFSGQGVVIGNIKFKGYPLSTLSYTSTGNILQVQKGLILSTGNSFNVAGYNNSHNQSSTFGDILSPQTDPDLSAIVSGKLFDICSVEFDFVPMDNSIQFNYQFGSDEYPEYVDSPYNDVFAFIVSDESSTKNIALIPGSGVPVSINTVNFKLNQDHFIDNNLYKQVVIKRQEPLKSTYKGTLPGRVLRGIGSIFTMSGPVPGDQTVIQADPELLKTLDPNLYRNLRYDGITKKLVAQSYVTPYKKYHLKIVIADVADNIYDSGVFIEDRSLTSKKDLQQPGFVDYPDLSKVIDPNLILQGKTLEEILPANYKKEITKPAEQPVAAVQQAPTPVSQAAPVAATPVQPKQRSVPAPKPVDVTSPAQKKVVLTEPEFEMPNVVILFDFDKSDITVEEMSKLRTAINKYKQVRNQYSINISGHTDNYGSLEYNYALSDRRNKAIINAVSEMLGEKISMPALSKSYTLPVADNSTDSGRQLNRRVELVFIKKK